MKMVDEIISFIKNRFGTDKEVIPLIVPAFSGNEKKYVNETIDSTFVSSVGEFIDRFENSIKEFTGVKYAVATVNGTAALHIALQLVRVRQNDLVLTQSLTFVATCNAIRYLNADPLFIDVDTDTNGLSPLKLSEFLAVETYTDDNNQCIHKASGRRIKACVPVHTFGHPCRIEEISRICQEYGIALVEDAAQSLGSYYKNKHTGTFGDVGILSFNGNKIVTSGGGGMVITNNEAHGKLARHLTTTAKVSDAYEIGHDMIAYNYRMPNLNAALGLAQMEKLPELIEAKRRLAADYIALFESLGVAYVGEPENCKSNFWLNAISMKSADERNGLIHRCRENQIECRPAWKPMQELPMFTSCFRSDLSNVETVVKRLVNIPSSVVL